MRKAMTAIALAAVLTAVMSGVAWAAQNVIQCPNNPDLIGFCDGTSANDVMNGTEADDSMRASYGKDVMYGHGGADRLWGNEGPDVSYGGPGDDELAGGCDMSGYCGEDKQYGGPGDDRLTGNRMSNRHFGGAGDDFLYDISSIKHPDVFHCGSGIDRVLYNKGIDKVSDDCEKLQPYFRR